MISQKIDIIYIIIDRLRTLNTLVLQIVITLHNDLPYIQGKLKGHITSFYITTPRSQTHAIAPYPYTTAPTTNRGQVSALPVYITLPEPSPTVSPADQSPARSGRSELSGGGPVCSRRRLCRRSASTPVLPPWECARASADAQSAANAGTFR